MEIPILNDIVTVFGISAIAVAICHKLKIPTIIGFLAGGMLAGPHGLGFVSAEHEIEMMAEIGVVLLLFTVGIEFSLKDLMRIRRLVLLGGFCQFAATLLVTLAIWRAFGGPVNSGIAIATMVGLSSTALVLKTLQARAELDSTHGRTIFGVLIFQDIIAVPAMLLIPLLNSSEPTFSEDIVWALTKSAMIIGAVLICSMWVVPKILGIVAGTRDSELFLISVVVICFVVAFFTQQAGLSLALGALLAGLVIAESPFSHEALRHILPFQQLFTSLFFASVGMLLNLHVAFDHIWLLLGLTVLAITIKFVCTIPAALILGFSFRTAILTAAGLAQIGEFSFVLARTSLSHEIITQETYQLFLAVCILSLATTPLLMQSGPAIAKILSRLPIPSKLQRGWRGDPEHHLHAHQPISGHAIIVGFGLNGRSVSLACEKIGIAFCAVEMNPDTVEAARSAGKDVSYGDAASEAVLIEEDIKTAAFVIITIPDSIASRRIVELSRKLNPDVTIIVRSKYLQEKEEFKRLGANIVVAEEFEVAGTMMLKLLAQNGTEGAKADDVIEEIRSAMREPVGVGR